MIGEVLAALRLEEQAKQMRGPGAANLAGPMAFGAPGLTGPVMLPSGGGASTLPCVICSQYGHSPL